MSELDQNTGNNEEVLVHFRLIGEEARALRKLAFQECRRPTDQVRFILLRELERLGEAGVPRGVAGQWCRCAQ
jgi:hypothetical protein